MNYFWTSDTHFKHKNIIKYSHRPFSSVEEMDREMIKRWNSVVKPQDTIFHLGDFSFAEEDYIEHILRQLNGNKHLIWGNHDQAIEKSKKLQAYFNWCRHYYELNIDGQDTRDGRRKIVMCHYPMIVWNKSHRGSWMLHGHCHHNLRYPFEAPILDVGVDGEKKFGFNYTPVSFQQIHDILIKRKMTRVDHHAEM